jgi:drug/metabolite transporter (DMT)-like permease
MARPCFIARAVQSLATFEVTFEVCAWILLTCVLALGVNVTNYLVIARTSPVTYQVVGHLKTCLILMLGFVVFKYPIVYRNLCGILVAVVGMVWYTEAKRADSAASAAATSKDAGGASSPTTRYSAVNGKSEDDADDVEMGSKK